MNYKNGNIAYQYLNIEAKKVLGMLAVSFHLAENFVVTNLCRILNDNVSNNLTVHFTIFHYIYTTFRS